MAAKLEAGDETPLPWASAQEMYTTIDAIQEGDAPFQTNINQICWTSPTKSTALDDRNISTLYTRLLSTLAKPTWLDLPRSFPRRFRRTLSSPM
jgi:hypothetical protein